LRHSLLIRPTISGVKYERRLFAIDLLFDGRVVDGVVCEDGPDWGGGEALGVVEGDGDLTDVFGFLEVGLGLSDSWCFSVCGMPSGGDKCWPDRFVSSIEFVERWNLLVRL